MGEKAEEKKKGEGEKKSDDITAVFKFDMHCEGCAKKVRRFVKKFDGVEKVKTECSDNKLVVTGKVDPMKIKEKVEEKTKKKVELVSPSPNKAAKEVGGEKKQDDNKNSEAKSDDKKSEKKPKEKSIELPVTTVLLKTRVHCDGCAQKIKKIVSRRQGVQDVNVDLSKDLITVKGTMNMKDLLPYLEMKLNRTVELVPTKKEDGDKKPKDGGGGSEKPKEGSGGSEKPTEGGGGDPEKPKAEKPKEGSGDGSEKPKGSGSDKKEGGGDKKDGDGGKKDATSGGGSSSQENISRMEVNRLEYNPYNYGYSYAYDPRQQQGYQGYNNNQVTEYWQGGPVYSHPPQIFSDENPNACSVM